MSEEIKLPEVSKATLAQRAKRARAKEKQIAATVTLPIEPIKEIVVAPYISPEEQAKRDLAEKNKRDFVRLRKMVVGKFLFNECPGGELKFPFRGVGKQIEKFTMKHDTVHTVPLEVAIHLNENTVYKEYHHNLDNGKAVDAKNMYITSKIHRTSFIPLDYTTDAGYNPNPIAQVTYTDPTNHRYDLGR